MGEVRTVTEIRHIWTWARPRRGGGGGSANREPESYMPLKNSFSSKSRPLRAVFGGVLLYIQSFDSGSSSTIEGTSRSGICCWGSLKGRVRRTRFTPASITITWEPENTCLGFQHTTSMSAQDGTRVSGKALGFSGPRVYG